MALLTAINVTAPYFHSKRSANDRHSYEEVSNAVV